MKKKQKIKKILLANALLSLVMTVPVVYWADIVAENLPFQQASSPWSYNSEILISTWSTSYQTQYINAWNNSTVIWNYFKGYYYDSVFGFFKLDWSPDRWKNVHIWGSTNKCATGYGYRLAWRAYSQNAWYIDFYPTTTTFVYYCESDWKLHWKAYSKAIGFQSFEWIEFAIITQWITDTETTGTWIFVNDNTTIDIQEVFTGSNSNVSIDEMLWEDVKFDAQDESIFYIVK